MAEAKTVSIHKTTTGGVTEFLEDESFDCLASIKLLSFLAGALLRYEEEGIELNPQVVLCESIDSFTKIIPSGKYYRIGEEGFTHELGKKVLKECAALAQSAWAIFIERVSATQVYYGVFSYLETPTSVPLSEMITIGDTQFAVLVSRIDATTVRLAGAKGNTLDVAFSTVREVAKSEADIGKFADSCLPEETSDAGKRYLRNLIDKLLASSHGTILVCAADKITAVEGMGDAVALSPPIDVLGSFENFRTSNAADSLLELQRVESLLHGLLQSDGIVAFNQAGQVTAYRVFYRPPASEKVTGGAKQSVSGGARRRAFEGVRKLVGTDLLSALFRSQDGHTMYAGA